MTRLTRSKWFLPAFCGLLGGAFLLAQWIGGNPRQGVLALALMIALGLAVLLGGAAKPCAACAATRAMNASARSTSMLAHSLGSSWSPRSSYSLGPAWRAATTSTPSDSYLRLSASRMSSRSRLCTGVADAARVPVKVAASRSAGSLQPRRSRVALAQSIAR